MIYAVSEEGVAALKKTSTALAEAAGTFFQKTVSLRNAANGHKGTLGPHHASLNQAIETIHASLKSSAAPIKEISSMLNDVSEAYQEIIGNDRIGGAGADNSSVGSGNNREASALSLRKPELPVPAPSLP